MCMSEQFVDLYRKWWDVVRDEADRVLDSDADARDVAQRVFQRLFDHGNWRRIDNPDAFFRTAARNEAISLRRRHRTLSEVPLSDALASNLVSTGVSPERALLRSERRDLALQFISRLPPRLSLIHI